MIVLSSFMYNNQLGKTLYTRTIPISLYTGTVPIYRYQNPCLQVLCLYIGIGLPCDGPGFNSRSEWCIYRASRPWQGTINGGAVSK